MFSRYILGILVSITLCSSTFVYAITYPSTTPLGETPGGTFQRYFDNMYVNTGALESSPTYTTGCPAGLLLRGFGPQGELRCVSATSTSFFIPGSQVGDTLRYDGTNWIRNNLIYNNGTNIGIGTQTPTATLDINGQIRIRGGSPGIGRLLMSDTTGIASWYDPLPSLSGSFWAVGGNTFTATQNLGTISNHALPIITNNIERMRIDTAGNVGIGTATPGAKLEIAGQVKITGGTPGAGKVLTSDAAGLASWQSATSGLQTCAGVGTNNTCYGTGALGLNTSGSNNTAIGNQSLRTNTVGLNNTAIGSQSLYSNTSGGSNSAMGNSSLFMNTTGQSNTAQGMNSLTANISGSSNVAIGVQALSSNMSGWNNSAVGASALFSTTTGQNNVALGYMAGQNNTIGNNNIAIGASTNFASATASNQLNIGNWIYGSGGYIGIAVTNPTERLHVSDPVRLDSIKTSSIQAGYTNSYNQHFTLLTSVSSGQPGILPIGILGIDVYDWGGNLNIGAPSFDKGTTHGPVRYMSFFTGNPAVPIDTRSAVPAMKIMDNGNVGIGVLSPTTRLEVAGQVKITGGTPGAGKVLTSDAAGLASWTTPSISSSGITGGTENRVTKYATGGVGLVNSQIYDNGTQVGIGTTTPLAGIEFDVIGDARFSGDLTVQGKLITDTIVNRTVNNISISGSLLPDTLAPLVYRDIGSSSLRWNNLYLSGQVSIAGGTPGLGKILTSDANGLATWSAGFSGTVTASGITGGTQNYVPKFGTGGTGLILSQIYDTGTGVAIGLTTPQSRFEVWSGSTISLFHTRGTNNLGIGLSAVRYQTTGSANVGIGNNSLRTLTTGYSNTAIGDSSLYNTTAGYFNSALGYQALYSNNIGNWNVGIGTQSLWTNLSGNYNVALGGQSLYSNTSNNNNVAIGYQALRATIADNNVAIGYNAGSGITSGANNIIIGSNIQAQSNTASNQLNIGNWIYGTGGDISVGRSTMSSGAYQFEVAGGYVNSASGYCISGTCIPNWSGIFDAINGSGNYLPKWNAAGTGLLASRISDNGVDIAISSGALQQIVITPANQSQYQQVLLSSGGVLKKGLTTREKLRIFAVSDYGANNDSVAIQSLCFDNSTSTACKPSGDPSTLTNVPNFNIIDPKSYTGGIGEYVPATTTRPAMFISYYTGTYMVVNSYTFSSTSLSTTDNGCNVFPYYSLYTNSGSIPNLEIYDNVAPVIFTIDSSTAISNVYSSTNLSLPPIKTTRVGSQFISNVFMTPGQALLMTIGVQQCASRTDRSMALVTNDQKKMTLSITEL